jgi:hypothetical protein
MNAFQIWMVHYHHFNFFPINISLLKENVFFGGIGDVEKTLGHNGGTVKQH